MREIQAPPGYFLSSNPQDRILTYAAAKIEAAAESVEGEPVNVVRESGKNWGEHTVARFVNGEQVFPFASAYEVDHKAPENLRTAPKVDAYPDDQMTQYAMKCC